MLNNLRRVSIGLLAVCAIVQIGTQDRLFASSPDLVISQVYGGGGNSQAVYRNDFVELFNRGTAPVSLAGRSIQYASATGTGNFGANASQIVLLPNATLQPGQYFLVQLASGGVNGAFLPTADATGTINMSGSGGKVALVNSTVSLGCNGGSAICSSAQLALIVDLVGWDGANFFEGAAAAPTTNNGTAVIRKDGGATDTDNNSADFVAAAPTPRNTSCNITTGCVAPTNPTITAPAINAVQGDPILLAATVILGTNPTSTGITVTADLTSIGDPTPEQLYDDGTHGDVTAGDRTFSLSIAGVASAGAYSVPLTATDAQSRTASATLQLNIVPLLAIHDIQGAGTISPFVGQPVTTRGIVTGVTYNGFFIQAPESEYDSDPNTSEGVFVFTNKTPGPPAAAVVGNRVQVSATVSEYKSAVTDPDGLSMTELSNPTTTLLSTDNVLPAAFTITTSDRNPGASIFSLEKYEGMRVHVDAVISTSPTGGSVDEPTATSTSNGLFYGVLPGTARPFREAGIETPLPVPPDATPGATPPVFDANPERIGVDTFSVFLNPADAKVFPPPAGSTLEVTTGVTVSNITGPLDYAYHSYTIDTEGWNKPVAETANMTVQPVRARTADEFTVATINLERFYDTVADPEKSDAVLTEDAFNLRLAKASKAIRDVMMAPDIVGVEEMENLQTLEALAAKIKADSGDAIVYAPYLMEGHDIGGIDVGLLARTDKVAVVGSVEQVGYNTVFSLDGSWLNDRPSLVMHAAIQNAPYDPYPVTIVVNHLRSMSGIDGSDGARIRAKRLAQAVELAGKLQELQSAGDHVISVGDYNAFDVNDGYVDVMGLLKGTEAPENGVTLWAPSPVTPALFDIIDLAPADQRYSLLFDGNAQEIDHILVSSDVHPTAIGYPRVNADFPDSLRGDSTTASRISDHDPLVGYFSLPDIDATAPVLTLPSDESVEGNAFGGAIVTYTATAYDAVDGNIAPVCSPASGALFKLGTTDVACTATDAHGNVASGSFKVTVTDTTAPVVTSATPSAPTLWAPNHKMVPVTISVAVSDAVDPAPACEITGVTANDGATSDDWQISGALTLALRAERSGGGDGRIYTIAIKCVDGSGNVAAPATATVFVPHDQGH